MFNLEFFWFTMSNLIFFSTLNFSLTLLNKFLKTIEIFNENFRILGLVPAHKAY